MTNKIRPSCLAAERFQPTCAPEILCQKNMASCNHTCVFWAAYDCIKSFKGGTKSSRTSLILTPTRWTVASQMVRTSCVCGCNGGTHSKLLRWCYFVRVGVALRNGNRLGLYSTLLVSTLNRTRTLINLTLHPCGFLSTCLQFVTGKSQLNFPWFLN